MKVALEGTAPLNSVRSGRKLLVSFRELRIPFVAVRVFKFNARDPAGSPLKTLNRTEFMTRSCLASLFLTFYRIFCVLDSPVV